MTSVTLDHTGSILFAIGDGPPLMVAFDVATDPATPALLASTASDMEDPFERLFPVPSHVQRPYSLFACSAVGQHRTITAIDAACLDGMFVARWNGDTERLLVSDYFGAFQPDRFGTDLPVRGLPRGVAIFASGLQRAGVQSADGRHIYVIQRGEIGALVTLERAENMTDAGI